MTVLLLPRLCCVPRLLLLGSVAVTVPVSLGAAIMPASFLVITGVAAVSVAVTVPPCRGAAIMLTLCEDLIAVVLLHVAVTVPACRGAAIMLTTFLVPWLVGAAALDSA